MKRALNYLLLLSVLSILGLVYAKPDWIVDPPIMHDSPSISNEKCPDGYYLQGYDKDTSAPVCSAPPSGCPYAERIPKDSPHCVAPSTSVYYTPIEPPAMAEPFTGK